MVNCLSCQSVRAFIHIYVVSDYVIGARCEEMSSVASAAESESDRLDMLEQCASLFARLQGDYYEEYHVYELSTLAVAVVYPLVRQCRRCIILL